VDRSRAEGGEKDLTFNAGGAGASNFVWSVALQPDGKILIGGGFGNYNGAGPSRITRLNADGTRDTTFNVGGTGADNIVMAVVVQPDGKIIIGGQFTSYNDNVPGNYLMRLNANGTPDTTFSAGGTGASSFVRAVAFSRTGRSSSAVASATTMVRGHRASRGSMPTGRATLPSTWAARERIAL
jgi:uncharacterized delta-60 repeat protein